jgi:hypothetical protein
MHMLYNSDSFSIVQFEMPEVEGSTAEPSGRGGFEIVDKFARKEIFIEGALAASFMAGVEALINDSPSEEELDDYIGRFSSLMQQPLTMH